MKCMHMISRDRDHSKEREPGGRGQLPFGTFPEFDQFWYPDQSLVKPLEPSKCVFFDFSQYNC